MNIAAIDLNLLRAFDALMALRNVSAAGVKVGLSQPAMSNAVGRLRKMCGDPLFVRTNRGMQPTPFAQELAPAVRQALTLIAAALESSQRFDPATSTRRFTLVLSDVGAVLYLPKLLATIAGHAPRVDLRVLQLPEDRIQLAMENLEADLVVGNPNFPSRTLYQQRLFQDCHVCLMRKGHPLANRRLTRSSYVRAAHVVTRLPWGATFIERTLSDLGITRRVQVEVPGYVALLRVVQCTDLLATVPKLAMQLAPEPSRLTFGNLPVAVPDTQVRQYWHPRFHRDLGNRWLRSLFVQLFGDSSASVVPPN
jgi:DNA-binding transcriptional LysR family regulator